MPVSRGALGASPAASDQVLGGEALYNQGMAFYRRRQWHKARDCFQRLKGADPGRRGLDSLLEELDIFIRLESFEATSLARRQVEGAAQTTLAVGAERGPSRWPAWFLPAAVGVLMVTATLAIAVPSLVSPRTTQRVKELWGLSQAQSSARNWSRAIDAYEEWLLLDPDDAQARHGLWIAYHERGEQRAATARHYEQEQQYLLAAEQWEGALADLRSAHQVDPGRHRDPLGRSPRGEASARLDAAEKRKRWALLMGRALDLRRERRWPEAIQTLQAALRECPDERCADVEAHLSDCYLESGHAALAAADSLAQIVPAVELIELASAARPAGSGLLVVRRRARAYLEAATSAQSGEWDAAIGILEALVKEDPAYAGGRAREQLCGAHMQRAAERHRVARLQEALADYQAVVALRCSQQAQVQRKVAEVTAALIPTATATLWPIHTPPPPAETITPEPSPTP